jgi:hypothetical protein
VIGEVVERIGLRLGLTGAGRQEWLAAARWLWVPLWAFAVTRAGVALVAYLAVPLLPDAPSPPLYHLRPPENTLLDVFGSRWDTGFYLSIAEEGYRYQGVPIPNIRFASAILPSRSPCRPIMIRCAMGEPAPCIDSIR